MWPPPTQSPASPSTVSSPWQMSDMLRHAQPVILQREETQGSRGSLSYRRRYKRRLADAPQEKLAWVYTGVMTGYTEVLMLWGPTQLPYQVCFPQISHWHLTSVTFIQAKIKFWPVRYRIYRTWIWIPACRNSSNKLVVMYTRFYLFNIKSVMEEQETGWQPVHVFHQCLLAPSLSYLHPPDVCSITWQE